MPNNANTKAPPTYSETILQPTGGKNMLQASHFPKSAPHAPFLLEYVDIVDNRESPKKKSKKPAEIAEGSEEANKQTATCYSVLLLLQAWASTIHHPASFACSTVQCALIVHSTWCLSSLSRSSEGEDERFVEFSRVY